MGEMGKQGKCWRTGQQIEKMLRKSWDNGKGCGNFPIFWWKNLGHIGIKTSKTMEQVTFIRMKHGDYAIESSQKHGDKIGSGKDGHSRRTNGGKMEIKQPISEKWGTKIPLKIENMLNSSIEFSENLGTNWYWNSLFSWEEQRFLTPGAVPENRGFLLCGISAAKIWFHHGNIPSGYDIHSSPWLSHGP